MTYLPTSGPPIIIMRNGYGGMTATGATPPTFAEKVAAQKAAAAKPSIWDRILGFITDAGGNLVKTYESQAQVGQQQAQQALQQAAMPGWIGPAMIGAGVIGAVLLLRSSGKRKNPHRRRR